MNKVGVEKLGKFRFIFIILINLSEHDLFK